MVLTEHETVWKREDNKYIWKELTILSRRVSLGRDRFFKTGKELPVLLPVKQTYKR